MEKKKLDFINYYRAYAIIMIVAGHTLMWGRGFNYRLNEFLFQGGTFLFVYIAGYLFEYLSYKFNYLTYLQKKLTNVVIPSFIIMIPVTICYLFSKNIPNDPLVNLSLAKRVIAGITIGRILNPPLWFIGMICVLFLLAPLFLYVRKHKIFWGALLISSVMYTSLTKRVPLYSYAEHSLTLLSLYKKEYIPILMRALYFLSPYLLGMFSCQMVEKYGNFIKEHKEKIFYVSLGIYYAIFYYYVFFLKNIHIGSLGIFRILSCIFFLFFFINFESFINKCIPMKKWFNILADYSFGIFFVHYLFKNLYDYHTIFKQWVPDLYIHKNVLKYFLYASGEFVFSLLGSIFTIYLILKVLGKIGIKNTRMFIGVGSSSHGCRERVIPLMGNPEATK